MNDALVAATDPAILKAIDLLSQRIPLGATDLAGGLREAIKAFPRRSTRPRRVIYIGDGISRANILQVEEFSEFPSWSDWLKNILEDCKFKNE